MKAIGFRPAVETDVPFLTKLREATMRAHYEDEGIPYEAEAQKERLHYRFECARVVTLNGRDIGLLKVDCQSAPWMIIQIQVSPEYQRRGIGEHLLRSVFSEAERAKVCVNLEVLKANHEAKKLYERVGFREAGSNEHFFLMRWVPGADAPS